MNKPIYYRTLRENKPSYILGVSEGHTATAALLKNGEIIACASEERFTRKKLQPGIPKNAIAYCLNFAKINSSDLDKVAVADINPPLFGKQKSQKPNLPSGLQKLALGAEEQIEQKFPNTRLFFYKAYQQIAKLKIPSSQKHRLKKLQKTIPLPKEKFVFVKHHNCHTAAGLFSSPFPLNNQACLIFTCDGVGDFESATISKYQNSRLTKLISIDSQQSLGFFYGHITQFLGLKPIEDEYKVMGLAPYAQGQEVDRVYRILKPYFKTDNSKNHWLIKVNEYHLWRALPNLLKYQRFDHVAACAQKILEEILVWWVKNSIEKYKIQNLVFSGGVFANIKVNQKIAQLKSVKSAFFMPSPGDESNAFGAAYNCYFELTKQVPKPSVKLYLGSSFDDDEVQKSLKKFANKYIVKKPKDINSEVAQLLANNQIVARLAGRMEFGARALGNRSILANPKDKSAVQFINQAIKNRDFWMPFAPTILRERVKNYLITHKADSPFMNVAFDTTPKGQDDLTAAIHSRDLTTRPQILDRETNPQYYDLIRKFEKLTGIGAILNTSFNLHGEPIVCTPEDALKTFLKSNLNYLVLEDYLISKK